MKNQKENNIFKQIKIILAFLIFVYEEFFLIPAMKVLSYFKRIIFYNKIIDFFSRNIYLNFLFVFIIGGMAESSAIFAGYLFVKQMFFLGVLFYIFKIILLIPVIDLFKKNKQQLLQYKIIRIPYYYYILFKRLDFWKKLKEFKKILKLQLKLLKIKIKELWKRNYK